MTTQDIIDAHRTLDVSMRRLEDIRKSVQEVSALQIVEIFGEKKDAALELTKQRHNQKVKDAQSAAMLKLGLVMGDLMKLRELHRKLSNSLIANSQGGL